MSLKRHFLSLQSFWCHWSLNSVGELCRTMSRGVAIGSIAILLAACGDDSGSSSGPSDSASESDLVVATYDDLPVCSSKREGTIAYVKDEKIAYVCENSNWKEDSENDSELVEVSSSSKAKSSSSKKSSSSSSASKSKSSSSVSKTVLSSSVEKSKSSSSATPESSSSSSQTVVLSSDSHEESSGSSSDLVVATYDDLPVCSSKREGTIAYVKDEKIAYVCENSNWKEDSENDSELVEVSSSSKAKSSSSKKSSSSSSASKSKSSSSVSKTVLSSSVEKSKSSSSATPESSSSSSQTVVLSSDSHEESSGSSFNGWSWDVPKEARLNPEITYGSMTDSRDGKTYKTVKIGNQTWMAENLNYADSTKTPSLMGKSWCFGNDSHKCGVTGRLYTWAAAIDSVKLATDADNPQDCGYKKTCTLPAKVQGICPTGWHLPTYAEGNALFTAVGGGSTAGKVLKSQSGWYDDGNGTDAFGFSALPAGYRYYNGGFYGGGDFAFFWSSSEYDSGYAYRMGLTFDSGTANQSDHYKGAGYSVRCLKD